MRKHVLASMVAAATMGFFTPLTSHAFGLGKIEVQSALNEPFKAEIGLTALRAEEKDNLQVKLASEDEFKRAGLDRSLMLSQLQFDIIERDGQDKILVTSKQSIKEPFLDFLLAATAGSGVLIREYTVLLDPPEYVMAESRSSTESTSVSTEDTSAASTKPTTTRYQYAESSSGFDGSSYDVKRSDTLWNVALATRPNSSISVHQMMMALLKANPTAFNNNNVNGLKAGVTLQIPSQSDIQSLSKSQAQAAFAEQTEAWKNRNQPAVTTVTESEAVEETQAEETASAEEMTEQDSAVAETAEDVTASGEESTAAGTPVNNAEAQLHLVAPEDDVSSEDDAEPNADGDDEITSLTEQLTLAQETIEAQTQENVDFKARMDAMEEQLETMRRLISLKDADMARLQALLEEEDPTLAAEAASVLQASDSDVDSPESDSANDESMVGDMTMPTEEMTSVAAADGSNEQVSDTASEEGSEISPEQADDIVSQTANALNLDEAQVKSTLDKVKQFVVENKLPVAAGLLLILLVLWLIARRSNREVTWDEAVQKMDKTDKGESNEEPTVVAPAQAEAITDAPLAEQEPDQEKTVGELVEQADMFVGYADYVQARTSLEQARAIEPNNTLVAYKMLFVLYKQNQTAEFVELAESTPFDKDALEWNEIKQWGQELAPGNELFTEHETAPAVDTIEPADDKPETDELSAEAAGNSADTVEDEQDNHLEFDLNDFAEPSSAESTPAEDETTETKADVEDDLLAFDTNLGLSDEADTAEEQKNSDSLDIDINDDETTLSFDQDTKEPASLDLDQAESETDNDPDLQFDIGDLDEIDEAETKLDLAAAYIDMGDPEGARSILNEVISEGKDEQKSRAQELLNSLS